MAPIWSTDRPEATSSWSSHTERSVARKIDQIQKLRFLSVSLMGVNFINQRIQRNVITPAKQVQNDDNTSYRLKWLFIMIVTLCPIYSSFLSPLRLFSAYPSEPQLGHYMLGPPLNCRSIANIRRDTIRKSCENVHARGGWWSNKF